jgi:hypothetical protein
MFSYSDSDSDLESEESDSTIIFVNQEEQSSETNTDTEYDTEDDMEEYGIEPYSWEYDEIYQEDSHHVYSEKEDGNYYIGLTKQIISDCRNLLLMVNSVSPIVFFQYEFERIHQYLLQYSIMRLENTKVHIMKLCILEDETYSVVLKTHWLRLVQRHWKKVYQERKRVIRGRRNINNLRHRENYGRWTQGLNCLPNLNGILVQYKKPI